MTIGPPKTDPESEDRMARRAVEVGGTESVAPLPTETHTQHGASLAAPIPKRIVQSTSSRAMASGGMGTVYEAVQDKPRCTVLFPILTEGEGH